MDNNNVNGNVTVETVPMKGMAGFKALFKTAVTREGHLTQMHALGRIFTWFALGLICLVPVLYCVAEGVMPNWQTLGTAIPFMAGYWAVGLIEAISYAPLLGTGGQYLSFITGNIANLKLPCSLNSQNIAKVKQGSEEQEIVSTISIAVSSIVTTLIIVIGLIPLAIFQNEIVDFLMPVSPYVIPAVFGGLTIALMAKYYKIAVIPFVGCILICVIGNLIGEGETVNNQSTMVIVGMVISIIGTFAVHKISQKRAAKKGAAVAADAPKMTEAEKAADEILEGADIPVSDELELAEENTDIEESTDEKEGSDK